jgi:hypothetical protein
MLGALAAGCGEEGGVSEGARVSVYVSVPLHGAEAARGREGCEEARHQVARRHGRVGGVRIGIVCLDDTGGSPHWTLAAVGANARRATEDSASVGYIGELNQAATRFSHPILEAAGIAQLPATEAGVATTKLLNAISRALDSGSNSLRESAHDELR